MQRHFSNRGEALAEVTAARVLAARQQGRKPARPGQTRRLAMPGQKFSPPGRTAPPKKKPPKRVKDTAIVL